MRDICIVNNVTKWLILARFNNKTQKWEKKDRLIPWEFEDIRFRRATQYLDYGYHFYDSKVTLGRSMPISIPEELLEEIKEEQEQNPFVDEFKIDTREFFRNLPENPERISKKELERRARLELHKKKSELWQKISNCADENIPKCLYD